MHRKKEQRVLRVLSLCRCGTWKCSDRKKNSSQLDRLISDRSCNSHDVSLPRFGRPLGFQRQHVVEAKNETNSISYLSEVKKQKQNNVQEHLSYFLPSNSFSFSNQTRRILKWVNRGADLPLAAPDERLLGRHLLSAIYPSAETLEMFEIDKVAIVSAFSAFPLGAEGRTCGRHCWEEKKIAKQHCSRPTLIGPHACVKFIVRECQIPLVNSEFVTVLICYLAHAADVRVWKKRNVQDALFLPAETFLICSGFLLFTPISLSPTRGAHMLFSTQGLQTRTCQACVCVFVCVLKWDTNTHTQTRTGSAMFVAGSGMACQGQCNQPKMKLCSFFIFWAAELGLLRAKAGRSVQDDREGPDKLI